MELNAPFCWNLESYGWDEGYWFSFRASLKNSWGLTGNLFSRTNFKSDIRATWHLEPVLVHPNPTPVKIEDYTRLVPWQHRRPKFLALLRSILSHAVDLQNLEYNFSRYFDVDGAIGAQLDQIGAWVGISREIQPPLSGLYFTWDSNLLGGWDRGIWQSEGDWSFGITRLTDEPYRFLILAKIAANSWDGTVESAYKAWEMAFGGQSEIVIIDHQDMSMSIFIRVPEDDVTIRAILREEKLPLRPAGVKVNAELVPPGPPAFVWDIENTTITGGWDRGCWTTNFL